MSGPFRSRRVGVVIDAGFLAVAATIVAAALWPGTSSTRPRAAGQLELSIRHALANSEAAERASSAPVVRG